MTSPGAALPAYGLPVNPFAIWALDPLGNKDDGDRVSKVDGWKNLAAAEVLIAARAAADEPVFFVVAGPSSTGRSSVANYLVHRWATARGIGKADVVVHRWGPRPGQGGYSVQAQTLQWVKRLLFHDAQASLSGVTRGRIENLTEQSDWSKFADSLKGVDQDLRNPQNGAQRHLAAIMERGKGDDLVGWVKDCFEFTRAIVVITVDKSDDTARLLSQAANALSPEEGLCIDVGPISGEDVVTLIRDRWAGACQHHTPFDLTAAAEIFDSPRPIARVMNLLERMLRVRQVLYEGQDQWPAGQGLGFSKEQMRGLLLEFDSHFSPGQGG